MRRSSLGTPPKNVDEYLAEIPEHQRIALEKLRHSIRTAAPQAEEIISYMIPTYKFKGAVVHFAAFEKHCSFFVVNKNILAVFDKELQSFKKSGTTIQFSPDNPIPSALVKKIVKLRLKENNERMLPKK